MAQRPRAFLQQILQATGCELWLAAILATGCGGHPQAARPEPAHLLTRPDSSSRTDHSAATGATSFPEATLAPAEPGTPPPDYPFNEPLPPHKQLMTKAPAMRHANLSPAQCRTELKKRELAVRKAWGAARGIATPLRLSGPVRGVRFVAPGDRSVYGMLDCRLALTLDELAEVLAEHDVVKVRVDNMYRPRARLPGKRYKKSQHAYGLAMDVTRFELSDGRELVVERDWQGTLGEPPCGPVSRLNEPTEASVSLRNLVCDVARRGLFHYMLTPSYNRAHRDHLHLDIMRDSKQIEVR
jgi:hypothetical protein